MMKSAPQEGAGLPDPAPIHIRCKRRQLNHGIGKSPNCQSLTRVSSTRGNFSGSRTWSLNSNSKKHSAQKKWGAKPKKRPTGGCRIARSSTYPRSLQTPAAQPRDWQVAKLPIPNACVQHARELFRLTNMECQSLRVIARTWRHQRKYGSLHARPAI